MVYLKKDANALPIYSIISNIRDTKKNHKQQNMRRYYVSFKYDLEFVLSAITMHNLKDKEMYARIKFSVDINKILILSILVDTFISKISFPMQPGPEIGSISDA